MAGFSSDLRESIALDLAYLKREVPAMIDSLAKNALQEVQNARDRAEEGGKVNAPVVSDETGGAADASNVVGPEP